MHNRLALLFLPLLACSKPAPPASAPTPAAEKPEKKPAAQPAAVPKEEPALEAPKTPGVSFANVKDGATIAEGFELKFVVQGKAISPAGAHLDDEGLGHHHLIFDGQPIAKGTPVPADATHLHFGKGQSSHILKVAPGQHSLTLQFADGAHRSYGPEWAKTINVVVQAAKP